LIHGHARLKIDKFLQERGTLREESLMSPGMGFQQMAAMCSTVLLADRGMRIHNRPSVLQGNFANKPEEFRLFDERNP
jgi:hypothetical protein